jgi:hypothetical protein
MGIATAVLLAMPLRPAPLVHGVACTASRAEERVQPKKKGYSVTRQKIVFSIQPLFSSKVQKRPLLCFQPFSQAFDFSNAECWACTPLAQHLLLQARVQLLSCVGYSRFRLLPTSLF